MAKVLRWVANGIEFRSSATELEPGEISSRGIGELCSGLCSWIGLFRNNTITSSRVIEINQRIHIGEENVLRFQIWLNGVVLVLSRDKEFEDRSDRGRGRRIVEGLNSGAVMTTSEGINRVDVSIAGRAESGGVGVAGDGGGSLLTDLAKPDTWVARAGESVDLGITAETEEGSVVSAEESSGGRLAGTAEGFGRGGNAGPGGGEGVHNGELGVRKWEIGGIGKWVVCLFKLMGFKNERKSRHRPVVRQYVVNATPQLLILISFFFIFIFPIFFKYYTFLFIHFIINKNSNT